MCTTNSLEMQQSALPKMKWSWMFLSEQGIETWNECKKMQVHSHMKWKCVQIALLLLSNEFSQS